MKTLLIHLLVELLIHRVHVLLVALVVLRPLALQLPEIIAILGNVDIVRSALHSEAIRLVAELIDIALCLPTSSLQPTNAEIQGVEALGRLFGDIGVEPLHAIHSIIDLLVEVLVLLSQLRLVLAQAYLQRSVAVVQLSREMGVHLYMLGCPVFELTAVIDLLVNAAHVNLVCILHMSMDGLMVAVYFLIESAVLASNLINHLIHLSATTVDLETQCRGHVSDSLDGGVDVVIHVIPRNQICLRIKLGLRLLSDLCNVLRELVAPLVRLLQALRDILHPGIMRLQRLLHVPHVQPHRGDLRSHCGLHPLPGGDDGVRRINPRSHLIEIHIDGIHRSSKVFHVPLAGQDYPLDVSCVALCPIHHVFELTQIVLDGIHIVCKALGPGTSHCTVTTTGLRAEERHLLLNVLVHYLQLAGDLGLEVAEPVRNLLQQLGVADFARHSPSSAGRVLWFTSSGEL
mmetsp:Transcript_54238/g.117273  ORF Transcript_54238/g.117273 Transcript_54238/m.117273 type:complete len:458 (+) Transcript_54238:859-2232(+)